MPRLGYLLNKEEKKQLERRMTESSLKFMLASSVFFSSFGFGIMCKNTYGPILHLAEYREPSRIEVVEVASLFYGGMFSAGMLLGALYFHKKEEEKYAPKRI